MRSPSPTGINLAPPSAAFIGETAPSWPTASPHHHGVAIHILLLSLLPTGSLPLHRSPLPGYSIPLAPDFLVFFSSPEFIAFSSHRSSPPLRHSAPHPMSPYPSYTITPSVPASLRRPCGPLFWPTSISLHFFPQTRHEPPSGQTCPHHSFYYHSPSPSACRLWLSSFVCKYKIS